MVGRRIHRRKTPPVVSSSPPPLLPPARANLAACDLSIAIEEAALDRLNSGREKLEGGGQPRDAIGAVRPALGVIAPPSFEQILGLEAKKALLRLSRLEAPGTPRPLRTSPTLKNPVILRLKPTVEGGSHVVGD